MPIPQQFGHFAIIRKLGAGGMGTVYLAYNKRHNRNVALKMLPGHLLYDSAAHKQFASEAQMVIKLKHWAIVPVYEFATYANDPYIEMGLMSGGSLRNRLTSLSLQEINDILQRICAALAYAHAKHIIHRDLKPENILFDEKGLAYLSDFGIARITKATQNMTQAGTSVYMSPEQIKGEQQDSRTDIYLMGVVLFEMLTGQLPFGSSPFEAALLHLRAPVPRVSEYNPLIPPACDVVIQKAMAKERGQRFNSINELATAFNKAVAPAINKAAKVTQATSPGNLIGATGFWLIVLLAGVWWSNSQAIVTNDLFALSAVTIVAILVVMFIVPNLFNILKFLFRLIWRILQILLVLGVVGVVLYLILNMIQQR